MIKALLASFWSLGQPKTKPREYYDALLPNIPFIPTEGIPKSIHQIYYNSHSLSEELVENINHIKKLNKDCSYHLWDSDIEPFILEHYGEGVLQIYKRINPAYRAAQADLARYLIIYKLGGLYLDVKSSMTKPLAEILRADDHAILSHWDNRKGELHESWGIGHKELPNSERGEYLQWVLIYQQGNPILRDVIIDTLKAIEDYNPFIVSIGRGGVLSTTGPIVYTKAINRSRLPNNKHMRVAEITDLGILYSIYELYTRDLTAHKRALESNYWRLTSPLVPSKSIIIQAISSMFFKIWYTLLDLRWKLSGKEGQRS